MHWHEHWWRWHGIGMGLFWTSGKDDFGNAVRTAVINKRAGGTGLISGRKAFQRPMRDGIELLHAIQDVYLDPSITIA